MNGQRGSKPVSLDGPCNSSLSSSLTLSDGETLSVQGGMGVGVSPVNLVSSSSQAPAGLAVQQERKEPQNWAQDTQGRAAGFQTRCHLDPFSHPVQSTRVLTGGFVTSSTGHPPPHLPEDFRYPGWKYVSALLETTDMDTALRVCVPTYGTFYPHVTDSGWKDGFGRLSVV